MDTEVAVKPEPMWLMEDEEVNHENAQNEAILSADVYNEGNRMLKSDIDIEENSLLEHSSECNYSAEEIDAEATIKPEVQWLVENENMTQAHVKDEGIVSAAHCEEIKKELKTEIDIEENCILGDSFEFIQSREVAGDANELENEGFIISSTDKLQVVEGYVLEYEKCVTINVEEKRERKISTKGYPQSVHNSFSKCALPSETQFKCDICGNCFKTYSNIVHHINSHMLGEIFKCKVCNKCFTASSHLKSHMTLHTGEKPFKCKECSKCFPSSNHLKNHMKSHTREKPFKCKECSKCFTQSGSLKRHVMKHKGAV